jgi:putative spermidine/putrescine transport system permease protein
VKVSDTRGYSLLVLPATVYLGLVFVVPLAMLIAGSLMVQGAPTLDAYAKYLGDAHNRATVWTTVRYATLSSLFCLLLGYPFARLMASRAGAAQALLFAALLLPLSLSLMVRAFGWTLLLGREGPINQLLLWLGLVEHPIRLLFTEAGLILGTVSIKLPLMILPIYVVLKTIPAELGQAGASLGAGPVYRFFKLDLPLAMPGMLAGFALVFSQAAAAYVLPTLLGGARYLILSKAIVDNYLILQAGAVGSAISVLLLLIVVAMLVASNTLSRRWVAA